MRALTLLGFVGHLSTLLVGGALTIGVESCGGSVVGGTEGDATAPQDDAAPACVPACVGWRCEDDGCGGLCACAAGTICRSGYCLATPPIEVCESLDANSAVHRDFVVETLGDLTSTVHWNGTPDQLTSYFKHLSAYSHAWIQGGSPLVSTVEVTQEELDGTASWSFYVANTSSSSTEVCYKITLEPK